MLSCSFKRLLLNLAADYDLNHGPLVPCKMEKKKFDHNSPAVLVIVSTHLPLPPYDNGISEKLNTVLQGIFANQQLLLQLVIILVKAYGRISYCKTSICSEPVIKGVISVAYKQYLANG